MRCEELWKYMQSIQYLIFAALYYFLNPVVCQSKTVNKPEDTDPECSV